MHRVFLFMIPILLSFTIFTSTASAKMEIAVQDDLTFVYEKLGNREIWLDKAQKLHVSVIRVNLRWANFIDTDPHSKHKPKQNTYNFKAVDDLIDSAAKRGMKIQLTLMNPAPAWATSNKKLGTRGINHKYYGVFAKDVAQHFKGRVSRYSIWNEPNWHSQLMPASKAPQIYSRMYREASKQIWEVDKRSQVLFGELAPYGSKGRATAPGTFLQKSLRGGKIKADGFAQHPYDFVRGPLKADPNQNHFTMANTKYLQKFLKQNRKKISTRTNKVLPIYFTEAGQFNKGPRAKKQTVREKWLVDSFKQARKLKAKQMLQYQLSQSDKHEVWDTSLVQRNGTESRSFKVLAKYLKSNYNNWAKPRVFTPAQSRSH